MSGKKMGRPPSNNPKDVRIDVRLTKEEAVILDAYCQRKGIKRPQGVRDAVKDLENK